MIKLKLNTSSMNYYKTKKKSKQNIEKTKITLLNIRKIYLLYDFV